MNTELKTVLTAQISALETETERLWNEFYEAREALDKSSLKARFDITLENWADANRQLTGLQALLKQC